MVLKVILVAGGLLVVGYGVYAVSCKLRQRWYTARVAEQVRLFPTVDQCEGPFRRGQFVSFLLILSGKCEDIQCIFPPPGKGPETREPLLVEDKNIVITVAEDSRGFSKRSSEDLQSTIKRSKPSSVREEDRVIESDQEDEEWRESVTTGAGHDDMGNNGAILCSELFLEVISGPSTGRSITYQSKGSQNISLTVGRIPQNDLVLHDSEVSGKHALISWNSMAARWELVDMGSLNGTLVNQRSVAATQPLNSDTRLRGNPVGLVDGDVLTLGSTSHVLVKVTTVKKDLFLSISSAPFGVGVAADPMTVRRGGKQLHMEDVSLCEWPIRGVEEFGVFCIFDGHGGVNAAEAAKRLMPQKLSDILCVEERRRRVLTQCNASDVLQDALRETDAALEHEYEGCTATILLIWWSEKRELYAQCANLGDSECAFSIGDKHIPMTENHRVTSFSERYRLMEMGKQLREGETRLCGMNIARALGDKFLKEQDEGFSSEPYVSDVLKIEPESGVLAVIASDGLWDVMSTRRALHLLSEARDGNAEASYGRNPQSGSAQKMAEMLVQKAYGSRTKDNTSVIVLDFGGNTKNLFRTV